jgi:hypothetical protein
MTYSKTVLEQFRAQADEMIADAAKVPIPSIDAKLFKALTVAQRQNRVGKKRQPSGIIPEAR